MHRSLAVTFTAVLTRDQSPGISGGFCFVLHRDANGAAAVASFGDGGTLGIGARAPPVTPGTRVSPSVAVCFTQSDQGNGLDPSTFVAANGDLACARTTANGCAFPLEWSGSRARATLTVSAVFEAEAERVRLKGTGGTNVPVVRACTAARTWRKVASPPFSSVSSVLYNVLDRSCTVLRRMRARP